MDADELNLLTFIPLAEAATSAVQDLENVNRDQETETDAEADRAGKHAERGYDDAGMLLVVSVVFLDDVIRRWRFHESAPVALIEF